MVKVFTKRVHKLKQCTNLRLHDENYTSFVVSLLVHKMGGRGEGAYSKGGAYFKFRPLGGALIRRGRLFGGGGGGALIRRLTVATIRQMREKNHSNYIN